MRLVLLGTGTPIPDVDHSGPSFAVIANGKSYIIDAGPGVVRRALQASAAGIPELAPPMLDTLLLTHLHSDHTAGLPDLWLTPWVVGRKSPLAVYGPPGTKRMLNALREAYSEDLEVRSEGLEKNEPTGADTTCKEIRAGVVLKDKKLKVSAFRVKHGSWKHCFGFRFQTPGQSIVFTGDTGPFPELAKRIGKCDILVSEVYSESGLSRRPAERQTYHRNFHLSTIDVAALANACSPKLVVLVHQLYFGASDRILLDEISSMYSGPVVSGRDLDMF